MKIYTRTGDRGDTGLFGGGRVRKYHGRVAVYGTVDELNSTLGLAIAAFKGKKSRQVDAFREQLILVQNDLFRLGAELATPDPARLSIKPLAADAIGDLEHKIDAMEEVLEPLKQFILPGGSDLSARLHVARTVCRRAERELTALIDAGVEKIRAETVTYLNRLSDFLFVAARFANHLSRVADVPWNPALTSANSAEKSAKVVKR